MEGQNKQEPVPCFLPVFPIKKEHRWISKTDSQKKLPGQKLVCQLFSAFCSSACENFAAVFISHYLYETKLFFYLELLWVVFCLQF